jgi:hypothetical protein
MIGGDMPIQAELVEQGLLRHPALAHHGLASFSILMLNQTLTPSASPTFSTQSGRLSPSARKNPLSGHGAKGTIKLA